MANQLREKYHYWIIGVTLAAIFLIIGNGAKSDDKEKIPDSEKTTITANVPEDMKDIFTSIFNEHKFDKQYILKFTNTSNANFTVTQGLDRNGGELFAYTPFLAVIDDDSDFKDALKQEAYLVESVSASDAHDLDFKKLMEEASKPESEFNVYYPREDSIYWDEFYAFLLITANNGVYPKNDIDLKNAEKFVNTFLSSNNAIPMSRTEIKQIQSIPTYNFYFMTYVDFKDYFGSSNSVMLAYPKAVVNHNYYVSYDEIGKVMYDAFSTSVGVFGLSGYTSLYNNYYNTVEDDKVSGTSAGARKEYNSVSIPETVKAVYSEEEVQ